MNTIKEKYGHIAKELIQNSIQTGHVDPDAIYQEANKSNRAILNKIVQDLLLPGSDIRNFAELLKLHNLAQEGKSCLILMEHYSNFDLPNLYYLLENKHSNGEDIGDSIIAMAGMKLNVESEFVRAFTEAYTRIVIYPSRSLTPLMGTAKYEEEKTKARKLNMAALHEMVRAKHSGKIILLFPSGTRYRPGNEDTRRGLAEVDSYIKGFDYVLPIAIAGNTLRVNAKGSMSEDFVHPDCMVFQAGDVREAKPWRAEIRKEAPQGENPKQFMADRVMEELAELHTQAQVYRKEQLPADYRED
ncbi:1-acyl-sn-glycerol-3-phosphate acyltransferase [Salinispira pacifica]|uniref:Glycerol-3-phosphate o-acyltransferase, putative n=1 Tax=Salinispira pacifica TaxID=1307761 RepID=V5WEN4_9SPIO|nr:1-acyl-sn-glycerol-3-phosphate acyltransferase [Salinispira pacifica]AHC13626.1 glycerol-3-phosphate o-acyltransferase, putative [Salinispira pacifica]